MSARQQNTRPLETKKESAQSQMIEETSDGGNWLRGVLQEKARKIHGCDFHDHCISTQKLKVSLKTVIGISHCLLTRISRKYQCHW